MSRDIERLINKVAEMNNSERIHFQESEAECGIFWLSMTNQVIKYSLPMLDTPRDHDISDVNLSHFSYWNSLQKNTGKYKELEYTDLRRGRVIYSIPQGKFIVLTKQSVIDSQPLKDIIIKSFNLPRNNVIWRQDKHYEFDI